MFPGEAGTTAKWSGDISGRGCCKSVGNNHPMSGKPQSASQGLGVVGGEIEWDCFEASVRIRILSQGFCVTKYFLVKSQLPGS